MASGAPPGLVLRMADPTLGRTVDGARRLARGLGAAAAVVLFGGMALAVEAFKSSAGAFLSTSVPHVTGIVIGSVSVVVSALFGFLAYVLLLLGGLVELAAPHPPDGGR